MKANISIKRGWIIPLVCCCLHIGSVSAQTIYGDFPYSQNFLTATKPAECSVPAPHSGTNAATFTTSGLQLTQAIQDRFGAVFINNKRFKSHNGIKMEFEYMFYGGSESGDGMTVFFFDATTQNPNIGATGAGLGYAYNRTLGTNHSNRSAGVTGGYLGIGFDSYGNFKGRRWENQEPRNERRNGIVITQQSNSEVTLRGARGVPFLNGGTIVPGMEDGYTGYPTLISSATFGGKTYTLQNDGTYAQSTRTFGGNFFLTGNRKAFIEMYPHPDGGFYITVKIKWLETTTTTIINDYHYKETITYIENAMPNDLSRGDNGSSTTRGTDKTVTINTIVPEFLRVGFAAATGLATNIHLIKNLTITLPGAAEANPDYATTDNYTAVSLLPLTNDVAYQGIVSKNQVGNASYIDPASFRFVLADGSIITSNDCTTSAGRWQYNAATQKITFTPNSAFTGEAVIHYDIKGKEGEPYTDEAYRSVPTTVTIKVEKGTGPPPPTYVLMNRMVSPVVK